MVNGCPLHKTEYHRYVARQGSRSAASLAPTQKTINDNIMEQVRHKVLKKKGRKTKQATEETSSSHHHQHSDMDESSAGGLFRQQSTERQGSGSMSKRSSTGTEGHVNLQEKRHLHARGLSEW